MWKKVLYLGIAIILGFMVYIISYNSNQMNHLESLVKNAIASEKFYEVPMVWDGCFDKKSIIENNSEEMDIVLYPATSQTDISYGPEDNTSRFVKYEKAYYLYIFNTKFSLESVKTDSEKSYNQSGIEFSNGTNKYNYYFVVDDKINSSSYVASPTTKEEVMLKGSRDVTNTNPVWNFMRVTFTETMLNQITQELDGKIETISIKDSEGKSRYSSKVDMSFSQAFFTDVKDLFDNYNVYLESYVEADGNKDKINEAQEKFNTFYNPWYDDFVSKTEQTGYTFRFDNDVLTPSKLTWQTLGVLALYIVVVAILYVLLFHFKAIRKIFSRDTYKKYSSDSKVLVNGKWVDRSKAKSTSKPVSDKPVVVVEPDTTADATLETVTAGDIVSDNQTEAPEIVEIQQEEIIEPVADEKEEPSIKEEAPQEVEGVTLASEEKELLEASKAENPEKEEIQEAGKAEVVEEKKAAPKKAPVKKTTTSKSTTNKDASVKKTGTASKTATSKKSTSSKTSTVKKSTAKPKEKKDEAN